MTEDRKVRFQSAESAKNQIAQNMNTTHLRCLVGLCGTGKVFSGWFIARFAAAATASEGEALTIDGCQLPVLTIDGCSRLMGFGQLEC